MPPLLSRPRSRRRALIAAAGFCALLVPSSASAITNSNTADVTAYPWTVYVVAAANGSTTTCGGALISSTRVVTAAHCLDTAARTDGAITPSSVKVFTGVSAAPSSSAAATVATASAEVAPGYASAGPGTAADLAVVTLATAAPSPASPIKLLDTSVTGVGAATSTFPAAATAITLTGWGNTSKILATSTLHAGATALTGGSGAASGIGCADGLCHSVGSVSPCFGDFGDPAVVASNIAGATGTEKWRLAAVVIGGDADCQTGFYLDLTAAAAQRFVLGKHVVSVVGGGNGTGSVSGGGIDCPSAACSAATAGIGASITLKAVAAAGSVFTGWSGPCSGTGDCTVTPAADVKVTANFASTGVDPATLLPVVVAPVDVGAIQDAAEVAAANALKGSSSVLPNVIAPVDIGAVEAASKAAKGDTVVGASGSAKLVLGKVAVNRKRGTASIAVTVPGPGTVTVSGSSISKAKATSKAAGQQTFTLPIVLTKAARKGLVRRKLFKVNVTVNFSGTASAGTATATTAVVLKLAASR